MKKGVGGWSGRFGIQWFAEKVTTAPYQYVCPETDMLLLTCYPVVTALSVVPQGLEFDSPM